MNNIKFKSNLTGLPHRRPNCCPYQAVESRGGIERWEWAVGAKGRIARGEWVMHGSGWIEGPGSGSGCSEQEV